MSRSLFIPSIILLSSLFGCNVQQAQEGAQQQAGTPTDQLESEAATPSQAPDSQPEASATTVASAPAVDTQEEAPSEGVALEPSPPPQPATVIVPEGTVLEVRLSEPLSTKTNKNGDEVVALLDKDLVVDGKIVFPEGSKTYGTLLAVKASGRVEGLAEMTLTLTEIHLGQDIYQVGTSAITIQAEATKGDDAKLIGGAAGVGALVGGLIGGKKGAAVGAAVGGGAGTAKVLTSTGQEVEFEAEHKFSFNLSREVEVKLP